MKRFLAIGGGEMRSQVAINKFAVDLIDREALVGMTKPYAVFLPQASHESKPYTNSFFKTYGKLKCKADVILFQNGEMDRERIAYKLGKADIIYIGGGDMRYMLDEFAKMGIGDLISEAYDRGAVVIGNSAGAMCMYDSALSDYLISRGEGDDYVLVDGYGAIAGSVVCHADEEARCERAKSMGLDARYIEANSAVYYEDGVEISTISEEETADVGLQ